ncbi:MAG: response regulator transcription factor [Myxococcales bacterium]|nr:response regulator transcription factor [Myxococcales bacterium]
MTLASIMIVEDDPRLGSLLLDYLTMSGFAVQLVTDGREALSRIERAPPQLVLLDLNLPGLSGLEVLRQARPRFSGGILILTANKSEVDQVVGLELGADDYVTKPVEPRLLLARVRSVLRRTGNATSPEVSRHVVGNLSIDRSSREVLVGNERLELTTLEFNLLWVLASRAGEVVTRDELYEVGVGSRYDGLDRGVDIHLSHIRRKLARAGLDPSEIKSIRGAGYLLARRA